MQGNIKRITISEKLHKANSQNEKLKNESVTKIRIRYRKQEYDFQKTMKRKGFVDTQNQLCIIRIWKI